ncbi:26S proteasome regulatory subunit RPN13 [Spathaspora sp. JA1]|nr:26S proteasome regulatory subunit RPN13 [Spathaspora sp. JA1]
MATSKPIKFHAGKVQYDDETNRCTPLPHKGVISIKPSVDEPDFLDFTWSAKSDSTQTTVSGNIEKDEFLLIPGDVTIKQIKSCTTGRVIGLTFLSSGAKYLYWLQDVGDIDQLDKWTEKDEKIIREISELICAEEEDEEEEEEEEEEETPSEEVEVKDGDKKKKRKLVTHTNFKGSANNAIATPTKLPISSISSVLDVDTINTHLESLTSEQLKQLYGDYLPKSITENPTKEQILDVIRSGFFKQSEQKLSQLLNQGNGAGYLLAQSLKFDYHGEGIDGFLTGIRELAKKEKEKEDKNEQVEEDTEMKD